MGAAEAATKCSKSEDGSPPRRPLDRRLDIPNPARCQHKARPDILSHCALQGPMDRAHVGKRWSDALCGAAMTWGVLAFRPASLGNGKGGKTENWTQHRGGAMEMRASSTSATALPTTSRRRPRGATNPLRATSGHRPGDCKALPTVVPVFKPAATRLPEGPSGKEPHRSHVSRGAATYDSPHHGASGPVTLQRVKQNTT